MTEPFALVLTDAPRLWNVGTMTTALRLALDAQRAGASSIHVSSNELLEALHDSRLTLPVTTESAPDELPTIEVAADLVVHPASFAALIEALRDGRARSLGSLVARPARPHRESEGSPTPLVFATQYGFPPMQVRDGTDARRALALLLRACRKPEDGWTSRWINRYVSLLVTRALLPLGLRPNHVSLFILGIGLAGAWLATRGDRVSLVQGAALLQLQSMLDGCDGEIARITHRTSRLGEWLDTIGDDLSNYGYFAGASFGLWRTTHALPWLVAGCVTVGCGTLASLIAYRRLRKMGTGDLLRFPIARDGGGPFAIVRPLFKRDTFVLLTFLAAAAGFLGPMLLLFALGAIGILIAVVRAELRLT